MYLSTLRADKNDKCLVVQATCGPIFTRASSNVVAALCKWVVVAYGNHNFLRRLLSAINRDWLLILT